MIVRFSKTLSGPSDALSALAVSVRPFREPDDVPAWLVLRSAAFSGLIAPGRGWTSDDFDREFVGKPWWSPDRMWLATEADDRVVGSVALGRSGRVPYDQPCVMWLMVEPTQRRRGIGGALLATLECTVWEAGERTITLETHSSWFDAVRLYERHGYERST